MSLAESAIAKKKLTYFVTLLLIVAGMGSYTMLGQLEDPEFTVKTAAVITQYPGASPEEVEQEVTEILELKLQELEQVDYLESFSRAGVSYITVEIKPHHHSREIPQIFDLIRNKVHDATPSLPPQALAPVVADDVGQIFGFLLAIVGDGFSAKELADYADDVQRQLSLVTGVSRVDLWGDQDEAIYIDVSESKSHQLGISPQTLLTTLANQNFVVNAGSVEINDQRIRIETTGAFVSPEEIEDLVFRASIFDQLGNPLPSSPDTLVRLKDFATVRRGYIDPPSVLMRYDGKPAVALSASVTAGSNVVDIGRALDAKIEELKLQLPVGIEFHKVAWQSDLVEESIASFMISLAQAILIVLVVIWLAMGRNNALIIGSALLLTILGSFIMMGLLKINLERMSLGALVIALGMMVDNAIVVADGATVNMQKGMDRVRAAVRAASGTSIPLLGATIIAVSFFYPIYASTQSTGEYCASLFLVVAISLLLSWVISMTITPLQCVSLLKGGSEEGDPFAGALFQKYKGLLVLALRFRWLTVGLSFGALAVSVMAFPLIPKMFFPDASRLQFMVDYWAPEGTRIQNVSEDLEHIEEYFLEDPRVTGVASFIGAGPPRFYLPVEPQKPNHSYAQLIINVRALNELDAIIADSRQWLDDTLSEAEARTRKFAVGPGVEFKFEARISAPGDVPFADLRELGDQGMALLHATPLAKDVRTDWRDRTKKLVASYDQDKGRWTQISRTDMARGLQRAYDGYPVGQYREGDDLIPIVVRAIEAERQSLGNLETVQLGSQFGTNTVPLAQIASLDVDSEDPMIWRRNRKRTITVQAEPNNTTLDRLRAVTAGPFEEMALPPGYAMEWGGEYESSTDSQADLIPGMMPVLLVVALILIALFNAYRTPLVIALTIPFAWVGVVGGLLITQAPFGFMALLGAMSLAGMMIKNVIVLLDQVNVELDEGKSQFDAIIMAALSRLRPVCLAAATTILGVAPLLKDVFWVSMAVVIMGGLAFGTILTMVVAPVFYAILYKVHEPKPEAAAWPPSDKEETSASPPEDSEE